MYIKPTQSLTQGCVGQHMFHSQNKNHHKRPMFVSRNLSAPAGKILARTATGVTAGPANLGRISRVGDRRVVAANAGILLKTKLPD